MTFSDTEEHIMQKIMDVLRDEPAVEHSLEPQRAAMKSIELKER